MTGPEMMALMRPHSGAQEDGSVDEWANVLADFPLFSDVNRRGRRKLVRQARFAEFAAGDRVVSDGERANSLYVILGGAAKVLHKPAARSLGVGDYFGELALIGGTTRSATVVATQELHVMVLPWQSFERAVRQDAAMAFTMLRQLSAQVRRLEAQVAASA